MYKIKAKINIPEIIKLCSPEDFVKEFSIFSLFKTTYNPETNIEMPSRRTNDKQKCFSLNDLKH